jgi:signal transduction histidine kinase
MEPRVIIFGTAVILVLAVGIISFVMVFMRKQQQNYEEMAKLNESHQLDMLSASVDAQENVRRQIGGDLHDDIGTLLSATRMSLAQLGRQLKQLPETNEHFSQTNTLLENAISNVRRISKELMPSNLDEFGLVSALNEFSEKMSSSTGLNIVFQTIGIINEKLPPKIELIFYRIVQELTNNSIKHANPNQISIDLEKRDAKLFLTVSDDGIGFDMNEVNKNESRGIGIRNIESRLAVVNGHVVFDVAKGKGSVIKIDVNL